MASGPVIDDPDYRRFLQRMDGLRSAGVLLGLDRVHLALARLGHPDRRLRFVQIAGTNGKGSTAAMTERLLREAGVHTGLFTSPHLVRFSERIRLRGEEVKGSALDAALSRVLATQVPLTYFEASTLVAVAVMADAGVDLGVMETGLGGRLDAVTALPAIATAITSIGADHLDVLGPTLAHVAREKAAIARPAVDLLVPEGLAPDLLGEIRGVAAALGAAVQRVPEVPLAVALPGAHQQRNAALALALATRAAHALGRALPASAVRQALAQVSWPGRLERLGPLLLDCAHNPEGAQALAGHLAGCPERPRVLVLSMVAGKDVEGVAEALWPQVEAVVATRCASDRALPAEDLACRLPRGRDVSVVPDPAQAVAEAQRRAGPGLVVVAGSVFLVGQVRAQSLGEPVDPVPTSDPMSVTVVPR